jgi:hypothetical protein
MNCARCGHPIDAATTICPQCGQPVEERAVQVADTSEPATAPVPALRLNTPPERVGGMGRRVRLVIGGALALILIAAAAGGAYLISRNGQPSVPLENAPLASNAATATATSNAAATASPGAATPSVTRSAATTSAGSEPTAASGIPLPTATPEPRLVTIFSDTLASNAHPWPVGGGCAFQSGGYQISGPAQCGAPLNPPTNQNVSVTLQQTAGSGSISYGIAFRVGSGPTEEYSFMINSAGEWYVANASGGMLIPLRSSPAIHQGLNQPNTLEVDMTGSQFTFYINSFAVGGVTDGSYASGGLALLVAPSDSAAGTTVLYTDFLVTQWQ